MIKKSQCIQEKVVNKTSKLVFGKKGLAILLVSISDYRIALFLMSFFYLHIFGGEEKRNLYPFHNTHFVCIAIPSFNIKTKITFQNQ